MYCNPQRELICYYMELYVWWQYSYSIVFMHCTCKYDGLHLFAEMKVILDILAHSQVCRNICVFICKRRWQRGGRTCRTPKFIKLRSDINSSRAMTATLSWNQIHHTRNVVRHCITTRLKGGVWSSVDVSSLWSQNDADRMIYIKLLWCPHIISYTCMHMMHFVTPLTSEEPVFVL